MGAVVKENVKGHNVLSGADDDILRRDLREIVHEPLPPCAHACDGNGCHKEDVRELRKLAHKLLCALDYGLRTHEIRIRIKRDPLLRVTSEFAPALYLIYAHRLFVGITFAQDLHCIRISFVKYVINVESETEQDEQSEQQAQPTDEEKAELRDLTNKCTAVGLNEREIAQKLYAQWKQGGIEASRVFADMSINAVNMGVDPETGEVFDETELADEDIPFGEE